MFAAIDRLRTLKVSDVMAKHVISVSPNQTMAEVARQLAENDLTSTPVVNDDGRLVGMLSAADYMRSSIGGGSEARGSELVSSQMSSGIQSVAPDATLLDAGRAMSAAHVHRLPVMDGERIVGIVSTMDVVAAVLNAVEELEANEPLDF